MRALVLLALLAACGPTSYADAVRSRPTGPRRYLVTVEGNTRTSHALAFEYLHQRAAELCPRGYEVVSESSGSKVVAVRTSSGPVTGSKPSLAAVIACE
jgi:hypothetical protein